LDLANATEKSVEDYRKSIESRALKWLQDEVDSSVKLYLLHGRREPQKDKPAAQKTLILRHYLSMVKTQEHREAMTSIMLSTHHLAREKLRHVDHALQPVPRHLRLSILQKQSGKSRTRTVGMSGITRCYDPAQYVSG
jgi:hypothetical protein